MAGLKLRAAALALCAAGAGVIAAQEDGSVKVSVPKANVRSEPNDKAPVFMQVTLGTVITLKAIEGDWYRIQLPPDPRLGGARVEAYLSKKVAVLVKEPVPALAAAPAAAVDAPAAVPAVPSVDGMSVAVQSGGASTWLVPQKAVTAIWTDRKFDSVGGLAQTMTAAADPAAASLTGSRPAVWVWTLDGAASSRVLSDRRPSFVAQFKDVSGISPDDLVVAIVRLAPAAATSDAPRRVIAAARARADQATRGDEDWDLARDLRQDVVRADVEIVAPGSVQIRPAGDLAPGEYAVVVRPAFKKKVSGYSLLKTGPEARVFSAVWDFAIQAGGAPPEPHR